MMKTLLAIHIGGGSVALLSMLIPLVSRKGGTTHRRSGWIFVAGMGVVSVTALMMSVVRFLTESSPAARAGAAFLLYVAVLTGAGVSAGVRVLRAKRRTESHRHPWDIGVATVLTSGAILLAAYGIAIGQALLIVFAIIGLINGSGQLAYWLRPPSAPMHWWFEHMSQMLGACIAATTAFVVNNAARLGLPNTSLIVWLAPAAIGVPATIIWTRYYRKRFAGTGTRAVSRRLLARHVTGAAVLVLALATWGTAQTLPPGGDQDRFDVASLKPNMTGPRVPIPRILPGGELQIVGVTLRDLIRMAYPSPSGQVLVEGGPAWITADRFDLIAKTTGGPPTAAMLRALLQERFKLQARSVTREGTGFALVLARRDGRLGSQIQSVSCPHAESAPAIFNEPLERAMNVDHAPGVDCSSLRIGAGPTFFGEAVTMPRFAAFLSEFPMLSAPVLDRTGLTGTYSFRLQTRADNNPNPEAGPMPVALEEQLGLKLERATGPVDVVVVDRVERPAAD
jgi:uncharacterized protein (TIGR03435 family)